MLSFSLSISKPEIKKIKDAVQSAKSNNDVNFATKLIALIMLADYHDYPCNVAKILHVTDKTIKRSSKPIKSIIPKRTSK